MPTTLDFRRFFGRSPFPPLQNHMKIAVQCAEKIPELLEALFAGDDAKLKDIKYRVFELESDADKVFDRLSSQLPMSMFLPVHRHDLIAVLRSQESIADTAQDIAGIIALHLDIAAELHTPLLSLAKKGVETCRRALTVINSLSSLIETGFKGPDVARVHDLIDEVYKSEDGADVMGIDLTQTLYLHHKEKGADPVAIVFTFELIRWLGNLSDHAELVGSRTRLLIAR